MRRDKMSAFFSAQQKKTLPRYMDKIEKRLALFYGRRGWNRAQPEDKDVFRFLLLYRRFHDVISIAAVDAGYFIYAA